jgi:hypothetical protein
MIARIQRFWYYVTMKKIIAALALLCILTASAFGQADAMLNINEYSKLFLHSSGRLDRPYIRAAIPIEEDYNMIAALGGDVRSLDTPLEIALLSTCAGVADVRPAEANAMLGNARQADQKLGAAVFQEIQILRFLGDTAAVNRHEAVLQFITGRGNATRAEIEAFYRNNVRGLIAGVVDEEFTGKTVPATILAKVKAEFKKVLGDFYATPTSTTFRALLLEPIILGLRALIIQGTGQTANFSALLGPNDQSVIDMTNNINDARRRLMDISGEDFNPVNTDEYRYFRNGEFNYGNTQYYFRNILNSLNLDLDKMQETWERQ